MAQNTVYVHKDGDAQVGAFGCNGSAPQEAAEVSAALAAPSATYTEAEVAAAFTLINELRAALVANGICVAAA